MEACSVRSWSRAPSSPPATGSLASSDASITPAWQATTTSWPGWEAASASSAPATRLTKPVQLSPPGAMGRPGSASQSRVPNVVGELGPGQPVGLAGVELAQAALGHDQGGRLGVGHATVGTATRAGATSSAVSMARGSTLA